MSSNQADFRWIVEQAAYWLKELDLETDAGGPERVALFFQAITLENSVQNLTRLSAPKDFIEGHLLDVLHLEKSSFLPSFGRPFDLGSGGGVPGLLHAFLFSRDWVVCDSEKQKADFLSRFVAEYSLRGTDVVNIRAEEWLVSQPTTHIVTRAVGTVSKIMTWLEKCSTWNNLILFKGPNWDAEWAEFQNSRFRKKLLIRHEYSYEVSDPPKTRKIIHLSKL